MNYMMNQEAIEEKEIKAGTILTGYTDKDLIQGNSGNNKFLCLNGD